MHSAGNGLRVRFKIQGVAQINNGQIFTGVELPLELIHADTADAKIAQEFLAGQEFISNVRGEGREQNYDEPATQCSGMMSYELDLSAEQITESHVRTEPQEHPEYIKEQKFAQTHLEDACEGHGHGVKPGDEFGKEK